MSGRLPISAIILTFNEESNLAACLSSLHDLVAEIFVVDSGSTDATVAIARSYGATVLEHPFETHARQWTWALHHVPCNSDWVFGLDADQRITPELAAELRRLFYEQTERIAALNGIFVRRRQIFRGEWIRHGGYYPKYLLKLFRPSAVRLDERDLMDHHFYVGGPTLNLSSDIVEDNRKEYDIAFWIAKHNRYAPLQAREELIRRHEAEAWPLKGAVLGNPDQRVIWLKQRWYRLPLYLRPFIYFGVRYVFQRGFLDGKQGFIFHFLQAFWYRLLVDIHLDDLLRQERSAQQPSHSVSRSHHQT